MKVAVVTKQEFNKIWANLRPGERRVFGEHGIDVVPIVETDTFVVFGHDKVTVETVLSDIAKYHESHPETV